MNFNGSNSFSKIFLFYCRKISDHPAKLRLIYYLHKTFKKFIKVKAENGAVLQLVPRDYISGQIIFTGEYEKLSLNLALELLKNTEGCFLDVGGNIGLFTNVIAKSYPEKQIVTIEPEEANFKLLNNNLSQNAPNKAITLNIAVGAFADIVQLEQPVKNNQGTYRVVVGNENLNNSAKYYPMLDLKTILLKLNISKISLMKIDIEGYEMEALKGMDWLSSNKPDNIIIEYSDYISRAGSSAIEVLNFLIAKGYKPFSVEKKSYNIGDILPEDNLWFTLN